MRLRAGVRVGLPYPSSLLPLLVSPQRPTAALCRSALSLLTNRVCKSPTCPHRTSPPHLFASPSTSVSLGAARAAPLVFTVGEGVSTFRYPRGGAVAVTKLRPLKSYPPPLVVCDMFHLFPLQTTPVPTRPSATTSRVPTTLPPRIPRTSHTLRSSPRAGPMATHTTAPSATMHPHPRRTPADCGSGMLSIDCGSGTLTSTVDFSWGSPWLGRSWAHPPFPPLPHPFVPACSWGFVTLLINFDAVVKGQDSRLGALSNKVIHIGKYRYV